MKSEYAESEVSVRTKVNRFLESHQENLIKEPQHGGQTGPPKNEKQEETLDSEAHDVLKSLRSITGENLPTTTVPLLPGQANPGLNLNSRVNTSLSTLGNAGGIPKSDTMFYKPSSSTSSAPPARLAYNTSSVMAPITYPYSNRNLETEGRQNIRTTFNPLSSDLSGSNNYENAIAGFLIKRELHGAQPEPFTGEAIKFYGWVRRLKTRLDGLNLSPQEVIDVLETNTKGEPRSIVEDYQNTSVDDPEGTLDCIWRELYRTYGDSSKIFSEIESKVDKFPPIRSTEDVKQLRELHRLCRLIFANMQSVEDLKAFNYEGSLKRLYQILPTKTLDRWRGRAASLKRNGFKLDIQAFTTFVSEQIDHSDVTHIRIRGASALKLTSASAFFIL